MFSCGGALSHLRDLSSITSFSKDLISHDADQNHRAHYCEVERAWNTEQVHKIAQHLEQGSADQNANHRSFATAQRTTTEHRGRDAVKLIRITVIGGRD